MENTKCFSSNNFHSFISRNFYDYHYLLLLKIALIKSYNIPNEHLRTSICRELVLDHGIFL